MDLLEYVKRSNEEASSKFAEYARPQFLAGGAGVAVGRNRRQAERDESRSRHRELRFCSNRSLAPPPPAPTPPEDPSAVLRRRLKQWQMEREKKRQAQPKPPPPFKVGRAPPSLPLPPPPSVSKRETRACRKAMLTAHAKQKMFPSLAPVGAQFRSPKIRRIATPKRNIRNRSPRKPSIFTKELFNKANSVSKSTNKKKLKGTPKKSKTVKTTNDPPEWKISEQNLIDTTDTCENKLIKSPIDQKIFVEKIVSPIVTLADDFLTTSPFVTVTRGKKRFTDVELKALQVTPEKSAHSFRMQLDNEISRLNVLCDEWRTYKEDNMTLLSEDHQDMINVAVGQTQLLINKKFQQFRGLIDRCENQEIHEGEGVVKVEDLQGFWDMVYMQVENLDIRFKDLTELKSKNWIEKSSSPVNVKAKKVVKKAKILPKTQPKSNGLKAMIQAARLKNQNANVLPVENSNMTFEAGFFSVTSPMKQTSEEKPISKRPSIHKQILAAEMKKRLSMTPSNAAAILAVSSNEKRRSEMFEKMAQINLNKTPGKSILKTPGTGKKNPELNKSVRILFTNEEPFSDNQLTPNVQSNSETEMRENETLLDINGHFSENELSQEKKKKKKTKKGSDSKSKKYSSSPISLSEERVLKIPKLQIEPLKEISPNVLIKVSKRLSNSKTENSRLSYNLISFDSPLPKVRVTRSVSKQVSQTLMENLEN